MTGRFASVVTIIATAAGVLLPLILWWADQESKALSFEVVSKVALSPELPGASKISVTIDGRAVEKAFVSLVELVNSGSQPIQTRDYEAPVSLAVANAKLVEVNVVKAVPSDLKPSISTHGNAMVVAPLLLNPGDRFRVSIVTSGGPPTFQSSARIAGVRAVQVSDAVDSRTLYRAWRNGLTSVSLLIVYAALFYVFLRHRDFELKRWAYLFGAFACVFGAIAIASSYESAGDSDGSRWLKVLVVVAVALPAVATSQTLVARKRR